ncbi:MAG: hypothetical protein WEC00_02035 [Dongiaceae bacterium]
MIIFLVSPNLEYTHRAVVGLDPALQVRVVSYRDLLLFTTTPRATYIFTDFDRLSLAHWHRVAMAYRAMKAAGLRVFNDPAKAPSRYGLLRRLYEAGINDFNAYRVEERIRPSRWPVFLRNEGGHDRPLTDLVQDWDTLQRAIDAAIEAGKPAATLLIVEYCAEPLVGNLYRKLSSFQIGPRTLASTAVHEDSWLVKYGKKGIAGPALYEDELRIIRENPYKETLATTFRLADTEYGRADFGIVGGRPQIYEINTNPEIKFGGGHPSPFRVESSKLNKQNMIDAWRAIDTPGPAVFLPIDIRQSDRMVWFAAREERNAAASKIDVSHAAADDRESQ